MSEEWTFVLRPLCKNIKNNECNRKHAIFVCIYLSITQTRTQWGQRSTVTAHPLFGFVMQNLSLFGVFSEDGSGSGGFPLINHSSHL